MTTKTKEKIIVEEENLSNTDEDDDWDNWDDAEDNTSENNSNVEHKPRSLKGENVNKNQEPKLEDRRSLTPPPTQQQQQPSTRSSWWGGLSSVLNTATEGLGNITNTVSQGLNQVIGVPDPEDLARLNLAEAAKAKKTVIPTTPDDTNIDVGIDNNNEDDDDSASAFGKTIVSGVTTLGTKVLHTGLDTLEGIGKKTMNILQDNDPLLKNKRKMLGLNNERPNLSEVLKEAKKDAEELENTIKELKIAKTRQQLCFEVLFEQNCGLVHMEALEILSKESTLKLETLMNSVSGKALLELKETINEVKELMELEELETDSEGNYTKHELKENLQNAIADIEISIQFDDIVE